MSFLQKFILFYLITITYSISIGKLSIGKKNLECGKTPIRPIESRIVGGQPAVPYSWPWQAEICMKKSTYNGETVCSLRCGGSLIDKEWVLSAAHCTAGVTKNPEKVAIKLGTYDYRKEDEPGEVYSEVAEIIPHPNFSIPHVFSYDVSLWRLATPVEFTDHIQPICVPKSLENFVKPGKTAYVTGWGTTTEGGSASSVLRQVNVPFINARVCEREYQGQLDETMECAGRSGHDSCQGDSGGPLVMKKSADEDMWFQVGLVSWGEGCAERKHAGVYSRTSAHCDFIKEHVGHDICVSI